MRPLAVIVGLYVLLKLGAFAASLALSPGFVSGGSSAGCIQGVAVPAAAGGFGFNCLVFADGPFLQSEFDTSNTGDPRYKWFGDQAWPNSPSGFGWQTQPTQVYGTDFSINGSGYLSVQPHVNPSFGGSTVISCHPAGSSFHGTTFTGGYYVKMLGTWGVPPSGNTTWPLFVMLPTEFLTGGTATTFNWAENDMLEINASGISPATDQNYNYWIVTAGNSGGITTGGYQPSLVSGTEYDMALLPAAVNGGSAGLKYYQAGVLQASGTEPDSHSDYATLGLSQHMCLGFAGGTGGGLTVQRVEVWCPSISCMTTQ